MRRACEPCRGQEDKSAGMDRNDPPRYIFGVAKRTRSRPLMNLIRVGMFWKWRVTLLVMSRSTKDTLHDESLHDGEVFVSDGIRKTIANGEWRVMAGVPVGWSSQ
mmetsp:Transcript_4831/g.10862  ORF Transcript_4831/g.10862 Transcript_4831/m.10862 type:complete len:105 (-) Transcript_4831:229-543(-)